MPKKVIRALALITVTALLNSAVSGLNINIYAENVEASLPTESIENIESTDSVDNYNAYLNKYSNVGYAAKSVGVALADYLVESTEIEPDSDGIIWKDGKGNISWKIDIEDEGLYNLQLTWKPLESGVDPSLSVGINGEFPFEEAKKVVLVREWENATEKPQTDKSGNEYAQEQKETGDYITQTLGDDTGIVTEPYQFYLLSGENTVTFSGANQGIAISKIEFIAPEQYVPYSDVANGYDLKKTANEPILIQGEDASLKSNNTLIPKTDNSNAGMTPSSPYTTRLNYIGGIVWTTPGDRITWKFNVETSGYYSIGFRFKQSELVNGESWRWLRIDGKTPFEEAKSLRFAYNTGWQTSVFSDNENPYYIYLDAGEHTVSLEVTMGELAEYYSRLEDIVERLADTYINIVMITGDSPDIGRDYELFKQIPNLNEGLTECRSDLLSLAGDMQKMTSKRGNQYTAAMENMARTIKNMVDKPYIAQQFVSDFYTNYTSLSSWLYEMKEMPLSLDEIQIVPYGYEAKFKNPNIFSRISFGAKRLLASFSKPYNSGGKENGDAEQIRIWINWGQDQAGVLSSLIEDSFTPETGIEVRLELVNASLINGILSGNFPDLVMRMNRTEPVNLAIRGALYDLSEFEDCDEVLGRFQENAELPYMYKDGLYALPDTQTFFVMYTRDDVLSALGLDTPKTWDEFLHAATIIQRNNMNVYIPYIAPATTSGVGALHLYPTLLAQNNLSIYNRDKNATAFNTEKSIGIFEDWIDLYTDYGIQKEADFYNRFRTGLIPLGISSYDTYKTIYSAAPEIAGRWSISTVPGSNGNISVAGSGTGCGIIKKSEHKQAAWEYLKWWTSEETQTRFSNNIESILGTIGRVDTANVEAFKSLAWEQDDLAVLLKQWENVKEIPEVPGSYYVMRAIDQAYWEVVNGNSHDGDAIKKWSIVADNEIKRKIAEYS